MKFLLSAIDPDKRRTFYKALGKVCEVEVFDKVDSSRGGWEEAAGAMIETRARGRGLAMGRGAVELLAMLTGGDSRQVDNELEKIDLYLGPGRREAKLEDVRTLVPLTRAGVVFELGNALAARETSRCFALVEQLLKQGESAVGILLVAIVPTVRSLLLVKDLMQRHRLSPPQQPWFFGGTLNKLPPEATEHLPRKKDGTINAFALGLAAVHAKRFEIPRIARPARGVPGSQRAPRDHRPGRAGGAGGVDGAGGEAVRAATRDGTYATNGTNQ